MKTLKDRIKSALDARGVSQTDLAKACGVRPPSVNDWLSGKSRSMKAATAHRAAAFLEVNFLWLTEGIGPRTEDASALGGKNQPPENQQGHRKSTRKLVQRLADIAETINDLGLMYLIGKAEEVAKTEPFTPRKPHSKAA